MCDSAISPSHVTVTAIDLLQPDWREEIPTGRRAHAKPEKPGGWPQTYFFKWLGTTQSGWL